MSRDVAAGAAEATKRCEWPKSKGSAAVCPNPAVVWWSSGAKSGWGRWTCGTHGRNAARLGWSLGLPPKGDAGKQGDDE